MYRFYNIFSEIENMNEIIPGLYLGSLQAAIIPEYLNAHNISAILQVCPAYNEQLDLDIERLIIPVEDTPETNLFELFIDMCEWIDERLKKNLNVLIHCRAGISRSATIVIAYIMWKNNLKKDDAYYFVKLRRNCICPNIGFNLQLINWEIYLNQIE